MLLRNHTLQINAPHRFGPWPPPAAHLFVVREAACKQASGLRQIKGQSPWASPASRLRWSSVAGKPALSLKLRSQARFARWVAFVATKPRALGLRPKAWWGFCLFFSYKPSGPGQRSCLGALGLFVCRPGQQAAALPSARGFVGSVCTNPWALGSGAALGPGFALFGCACLLRKRRLFSRPGPTRAQRIAPLLRSCARNKFLLPNI